MARGKTFEKFSNLVLLLLIGLGLSYAVSTGLFSGYSGLSNILILAGLGLGVFYLAFDLLNKVHPFS